MFELAMRNLAKSIARRLPLPPIEAVIEPTKLCNLKCDYCRRKEGGSVAQSSGSKHFTLAEFKYVLDKLRFLRVANWIGDGEPLLNPEFNNLIGEASRRGIKTSFGTNATLVTKADVDFWKKHKVCEVSVSIDSPIPEEYEKMRVGAKFDKVINACKMISDAGLNLQLQIIAFDETIDSMPMFVDLCEEVGCWRIALPRPHLYGTLERYRDSYPKPEKANPVLKIAKNKMKKAGIRWYEPWAITSYFRRCMWPFLSPYIRIGGVIQPCCFLSGGDRNSRYEGVDYKVPATSYEMGNILTGDFDKIWYGEEYKKLRRLLIKTEEPVGKTITPEALVALKSISDGRFSYCHGCSWRWGIEC